MSDAGRQVVEVPELATGDGLTASTATHRACCYSCVPGLAQPLMATAVAASATGGASTGGREPSTTEARTVHWIPSAVSVLVGTYRHDGVARACTPGEACRCDLHRCMNEPGLGV